MGLLIDREKVIKGITHHKLGMCDMSGKICPYWNEDDGCSKKMLEDVLSLLKEQEAVPVIQREIAHMFFWCCGSCGVAITDGDKFCRMCGRTVKWE